MTENGRYPPIILTNGRFSPTFATWSIVGLGIVGNGRFLTLNKEKNVCIDIYIASSLPLPTIKGNDREPRFHIAKLETADIPEFVSQNLGAKYYYSPGTFIGCSCGFSYGDWSRKRKDEDHDKRVQDVSSLMSYLNDQSRLGPVKLLCLDWGNIPEKIEEKEFYPTITEQNEFSLEENTILIVNGTRSKI